MYGDFYESYFEHGCSILHERDVLLLDIKGTTCLSIVKRWWYDLFLLSYSNTRNRIYYHSSHAVKVERTRQYRRYKNCIHPLSKFREFWDFFILHVILSNKLIFYHSSSLISAELPFFFYVLGAVLEVITIFDIYVNMKCGYIDESTKKIVLDSHKAFEKYCSTKLFLHVAAAMPMHSLMFLRYGMNVGCLKVCKSNKFMCTLMILSTFSYLRFIEATGYWYIERKTYFATCFFRFLRIAMVALMTMVQYVLVTDTIMLLSYMSAGHVEHNSYYSLVIFVKNNVQNLTNFKLFTYDISRMFKYMVLYLYGGYYLEMMISLLAHFIVSGFYIWGLTETFSCVTRAIYSEDKMITNKTACMKLAKCRQLPDKLCLKLQRYYDFNMSKPLMVERSNGLYKSLPFTLEKEMLMHNYSRLLTRIPYFAEWPLKVIEGFVLLLKPEIFLKEDVVAEAGLPGEGLFILEVGMMAVYSSEHKEMGHLIDGDFFGELSLVTDKEIRTSYVVAITSCKILILEKSAFRHFMREHPKLFFELKQKLRSRYSQVISRSAIKENSPHIFETS